jgi:thiol-disulfide isomerase/thioredoxin
MSVDFLDIGGTRPLARKANGLLRATASLALASFLGASSAALAGECSASRLVFDHPPVKVGAPAPNFGGWTTENTIFSSADFRAQSGGAVIVVSFFATWCEPCKKGLPELVRVQQDLGKNVGVVLVAFGQDASEVKPFLRAVGVTLPVMLDPFETQAKRFGVSKALPRTFVIAPDGAIGAIYECEGPDFASSLRGQVERLRGPHADTQ